MPHRFLLSTAGSLGDLHPYLAVGRALAARGHEAVIATTEDYRGEVERAGLALAPVGPRFADFGDYRALIRRIVQPWSGPEYLARELVMPFVERIYAELSAIADGVDVFVSHPLTVATPIVAERRNRPWVGTVLAPMSLMSAHDPPVLAAAPWLRALARLGPLPHRVLFSLAARRLRQWERPLHALREAEDVPPIEDAALLSGQFSPGTNLALFDPALAAPQPDWPRGLEVCGAALYDGDAPEPRLREELETFLAQGEPPVVFALGSSAVWIADDFWAKAIAATRRFGRRALLLTGPDALPDLPEGVRAFAYLPYSLVFPRAAAIVHSSGIGTLAQAMRSGRPQLIVPVAFDQPDNARRAVALGVGRTIPFAKVTVDALAASLDALLSVPAYGQAAEKLAATLAAVDGAGRAAESLIAVAERR